MLYLLFVLTFLAGILFYGLSPNDKKLDETAHQAEGMIVSFLAQHQAAKDYIYTWLGANSASNIGNLYNNPVDFLKPAFEEMMPRSIASEMCTDNTGTPGKSGDKSSCFVSKIILTDKNYLITYGGWEASCTSSETGVGEKCTYKRPSWWPAMGQKMRRFESWRKAIGNRTRDSVSCGILFSTTAVPTNSSWCIDNGATVFKNESETNKVCMKQVPSVVIQDLLTSYNNSFEPLYDMLFCMSEFKQGWNEYYASGASYFFDGLSNNAHGQHITGTQPWKNLVNLDMATEQLPQVTFGAVPYVSTTGINMKLQLGGQYILTVLAAIPTSTRFDIFQAAATANDTMGDSIFYKASEKSDQADYFWVNYGIYPSFAQRGGPACNMAFEQNNTNAKLAKGIISWTFVVRTVDGHQQIDVYENAMKRSMFSNKDISSTVGKYLLIGGSSSGTASIYGVRYYPLVPPEEKQVQALIQKNFKVDQKRFGLSDINNGETGDQCINESNDYTGPYKIVITGGE